MVPYNQIGFGCCSDLFHRVSNLHWRLDIVKNRFMSIISGVYLTFIRKDYRDLATELVNAIPDETMKASILNEISFI